MSALSPAVSVRVTPIERDLLEAAATHSRTNLSEFIRRKALEAAEIELLDRTVVTIPATSWEVFESWAQAPARTIPALRDLAASRPVWQD